METAAADEEQQLVKAEMAVHPLWEQLLVAHVGCLRVATPTDHLPLIDAQLAQSHHLVRYYGAAAGSLRHPVLSPQDKQELDAFLAQYAMALGSFREQLQQHVRMHAVEAVMACREMEQSLQGLTGVTLEEGLGATMSDDEDELGRADCPIDDMVGFGPLLPTESERSLMETVKQGLKIELKQGFRSRIEDVREEILRKRRSGKLPGDTTSILKQWWQQNSKWPYPTEDDKAKFVEETGLQLKQINNWFINQRKRNWHSNSQSATTLKSRRKRSSESTPLSLSPNVRRVVRMSSVTSSGDSSPVASACLTLTASTCLIERTDGGRSDLGLCMDACDGRLQGLVILSSRSLQQLLCTC